MFRKTIVRSEEHFEQLKTAYRKLKYIPLFKNPNAYPCVMITFIDDDPTRLDYMGEVYNCFIYKEEIENIY